MLLFRAIKGGRAEEEKKEGEEVPCLAGERLMRLSPDVTFLCPYAGPLKGNLYLTNYKLHFASRDRGLSFEVPLGLLNRVEKVGGASSRGENSYGIEVFCKDVRSLKFKFAPNPEENQSSREFFEDLETLAFSSSRKGSLFAFQNGESFAENGWSVYEPIQELKRLLGTSKSWKVSRINEKYSVCESYPAVWGVPYNADEELLAQVASFRSKGRLPVLSWLHPSSQTSITRCAEPLVGVGRRERRSTDDEEYLQMIVEANPNPEGLVLCVVDARTSAEALASRPKGGGYESEEVYENVELVFLDVQDGNVVKRSLEKLTDICFPTIDDNKWFSNVEETKWLEHIKCIISGAVRIVDKVENHKTSVLVHCSDGWDRTSQLTSLSMLLLDPFYRTLKGFEILIEKEWLSFGHKFQHRIGHGDERHSDADRSPVFLQWVDAVYQVTLQFPHAFEFNEYLLLTILEHLYSCRFGTFLFNTEKERVAAELKRRTVSLWSYVNSNRDLFLNPFFTSKTSKANQKNQNRVILPNPAIRHLKPWTSYYCKWNKGKGKFGEENSTPSFSKGQRRRKTNEPIPPASDSEDDDNISVKFDEQLSLGPRARKRSRISTELQLPPLHVPVNRSVSSSPVSRADSNCECSTCGESRSQRSYPLAPYPQMPYRSSPVASVFGGFNRSRNEILSPAKLSPFATTSNLWPQAQAQIQMSFRGQSQLESPYGVHYMYEQYKPIPVIEVGYGYGYRNFGANKANLYESQRQGEISRSSSSSGFVSKQGTGNSSGSSGGSTPVNNSQGPSQQEQERTELDPFFSDDEDEVEKATTNQTSIPSEIKQRIRKLGGNSPIFQQREQEQEKKGKMEEAEETSGSGWKRALTLTLKGFIFLQVFLLICLLFVGKWPEELEPFFTKIGAFYWGVFGSFAQWLEVSLNWGLAQVFPEAEILGGEEEVTSYNYREETAGLELEV